MTRDLWYTGAPLDRLSHRRADEVWLDARRRAVESRIVPVWRSRNLVHAEDDAALMPTVAEAADLLEIGRHPAMMGVRDGVAYFAVDVSHLDDPTEHPALGQGAFEDLRAVGPVLSRSEGAILAHARGLMHWHNRHGFCGVCGSQTEMAAAGYQRVCTNPDCQSPHFPRTDPAVIMLVYKGDKCLLGRSGRFRGNMYSTLAGFVEPGESLEEAVAREVLEETGVVVQPKNVSYYASQPWPFPASLMLGFHAEADTEELILDDEEIEDAKWVHRLQMDNLEELGMSLPRTDSIAYRLIRAWMDGEP